MKRVVFVASIVLAFGMGYAFSNLSHFHRSTELKRVTGIGGIFFKCKDPKKVRAWYADHLGLATNSYGAVFEWYQGA
ncbi:MAG: VOC family protein, partial [Sphingobacterium sp.]